GRRAAGPARLSRRIRPGTPSAACRTPGSEVNRPCASPPRMTNHQWPKPVGGRKRGPGRSPLVIGDWSLLLALLLPQPEAADEGVLVVAQPAALGQRGQLLGVASPEHHVIDDQCRLEP